LRSGRKPAREDGQQGSEAARCGFRFGRRDLDEALLKANVFPIQAHDLRLRRPANAPIAKNGSTFTGAFASSRRISRGLYISISPSAEFAAATSSTAVGSLRGS
jgi:hypothetical protein